MVVKNTPNEFPRRHCEVGHRKAVHQDPWILSKTLLLCESLPCREPLHLQLCTMSTSITELLQMKRAVLHFEDLSHHLPIALS